MNNNLLKIAQAITESLAEYSAVMELAPDYDLPSLNTRRVVVVPFAIEYKMSSRATTEVLYRVEIGVLYRAAKIDLDAMIAQVEKIGMSLLRKKFLSATCITVGYEPIYSPDDLRAKNQFTSVISLTLKDFQ